MLTKTRLIKKKTFFLISYLCLFPIWNLYSQDFIEIKLIDSISVLFDSGSSIIKNKSELINQLNQVKQKQGKIELVSYTDTIGSLEFNRGLASNRILSVLNILNSSNLAGFVTDSLNQNEQRKGKQMNENIYRRVDILIYSVEAKIKFNVTENLKINFHSGSDNIVKSSIKNLKMLHLLMQIDTTINIRLNGHVCCKPELSLSLMRAERVKSYLVTNGINSNRIVCKGFSNTFKLVPETSEQNERKNMRVEVVFIK